MTDGHRLDYVWDEGAGRERFAEALAVVDEARAHLSGRLSGIVAPSQVEPAGRISSRRTRRGRAACF